MLLSATHWHVAYVTIVIFMFSRLRFKSTVGQALLFSMFMGSTVRFDEARALVGPNETLSMPVRCSRLSFLPLQNQGNLTLRTSNCTFDWWFLTNRPQFLFWVVQGTVKTMLRNRHKYLVIVSVFYKNGKHQRPHVRNSQGAIHLW